MHHAENMAQSVLDLEMAQQIEADSKSNRDY